MGEHIHPWRAQCCVCKAWCFTTSSNTCCGCQMHNLYTNKVCTDNLALWLALCMSSECTCKNLQHSSLLIPSLTTPLPPLFPTHIPLLSPLPTHTPHPPRTSPAPTHLPISIYFDACRGGGLLTRLIYARFQELVTSGHMHALPTLLPGQWHAGLKAVKTILRRIFIKRDRAWKSYTKVPSTVTTKQRK